MSVLIAKAFATALICPFKVWTLICLQLLIPVHHRSPVVFMSRRSLKYVDPKLLYVVSEIWELHHFPESVQTIYVRSLGYSIKALLIKVSVTIKNGLGIGQLWVMYADVDKSYVQALLVVRMSTGNEYLCVRSSYERNSNPLCIAKLITVLIADKLLFHFFFPKEK